MIISQKRSNLIEDKRAAYFVDNVIQTPRTAIQTAIETFVNEDFETRWFMAKQLKEYGVDAIAPLIQILSEQSGLRSITPSVPLAAEAIADEEELQCFIVEIIGATDHPDAVMALVTLLHESRHEAVTLAIAKTLASFGTSHLDCLMNCQNELQLHLPVVKALALIEHPKTIQVLMDYVESPNAEVRTIAHEALGQFHQPHITTQLLKALSDSNSAVRVVALKALGMRTQPERDAQLVDAIAPLLFDTHPKVCQQAAQALGRFDDPKAIEAIWDRLRAQQESSELTSTLIQSLGWSVHPRGVDYLLRILKLVSTQEQDQHFQPQWPAMLLSEVVRVLARVTDPVQAATVTDAFVDLLQLEMAPFPQPSLQRTIISAIAQLGQSTAIPSLGQHLRIADDGTRFHIIAALKQLDRQQSFEWLQCQNQKEDLDPQLVEGISVALREW